MSVPLSVVAKLRGAHLVNWLQDLLPEAAGALGMGWAKRWPGRVLKGLRNRSLNGAALNVSICEQMAQELSRQGVHGIRVIPNWPDGRIRPVRRETNPLRARWGLEQSFVIGYSGNLGKAHCAQSVAHLVRESRKLPGVRWLFIGGGSGQEAVKQAAEEAGVEVDFQPYQLRASLSDSLSVPDIHLVTLDPACEGLIMPSKLYGVMAAGRPVIALGDPQGSVAREVMKGKMGVVLDINAPDGWVETLRPMLSFEAADLLGSTARQYYENRFTPERVLDLWMETLDEAGGGPVTAPSVPVAWANDTP
jgi:glycosyltransferase involved in cell wall biosynthesis